MTRLYRSRRDKKVFGLCGGLAEIMNVDATLLRLVVVVTTVFSGGSVILLYILASIVIPKEAYMDGQPGMNAYAQSHTPYGVQAGAFYGTVAKPAAEPQPAKPDLDAMMKDVETKAMWKEIEELRAKLAKYEKGEE